MLDAAVRNSGFDRYLEAVISVDAKKTYKPDPRAYELIQERTGVRPEEVVFLSSNEFDVAGAKSCGFKVALIKRVLPAALCQELPSGAPIGPATMFRALRMQTEALGLQATSGHFVVRFAGYHLVVGRLITYINRQQFLFRQSDDCVLRRYGAKAHHPRLYLFQGAKKTWMAHLRAP